VDTIEDEPLLQNTKKNYFCQQFVTALEGGRNAERFARQLSAALSRQTPAAEHTLIRNAARVIEISRAFPAAQWEAVQSCVRTMATGMAQFQLRNEKEGLKNLADLDRYCYYVAGVVGQMLTRLFCLHSPEMARNHDAIMELAVSFGQGLQMTNILKDVWEDYGAGFCWLPREVFEEEGFDLRDLSMRRDRQGFERGIQRLIGVAHGHLRNALSYTLLIPKQEIGIRNFCLWAIGLAVLTLRKINGDLGYSNGAQVKISRTSVKATIMLSKFAVQHDRLVKLLFYLSATGLPLTLIETPFSPAEKAELKADSAR